MTGNWERCHDGRPCRPTAGPRLTRELAEAGARAVVNARGAAGDRLRARLNAMRRPTYISAAAAEGPLQRTTPPLLPEIVTEQR